MRLNSDLVEALALVRDIWPSTVSAMLWRRPTRRPHCASSVIRFDHNLHALRIVEQFEQRYLAFPGLNLTFEVREGIIKHSHDYRGEEAPPELAEYLLDELPPLEAQLIDVVDEIAYNIADLDDGFEARLLDFDVLRAGSATLR